MCGDFKRVVCPGAAKQILAKGTDFCDHVGQLDWNHSIIVFLINVFLFLQCSYDPTTQARLNWVTANKNYTEVRNNFRFIKNLIGQ